MPTIALTMLMSVMLAGQGATASEPVLVSAEWLAAHVNDSDVVVLHVGVEADGYLKEHIPGARALTRADIVDDSDLGAELLPVATLADRFARVGVSTGSRVIVYGETPPLATRAFFTLEYLGHERVAVLDGGLVAWKALGRPTTAEVPRVGPGQFTPRVRSDRLADAEWVRAHTGDAKVSIVDSRTLGEFTGADGGKHGTFVVAAGHVPGAKLVDWTELVSSPELPTLLGRDELAAKLSAAGVQPGSTVVSYCTVGMRASFGYFVARYLGHDAKMYDGSMTDWTRRQLPVDRQPPR